MARRRASIPQAYKTSDLPRLTQTYLAETKRLERNYASRPFDLRNLVFVASLYATGSAGDRQGIPDDFYCIQARVTLLRFNKYLSKRLGKPQTDLVVRGIERVISTIGGGRFLANKEDLPCCRTFVLDQLAIMYLAENLWKPLSHKEKERIEDLRRQSETFAKRDWEEILKPILAERSYVVRLVLLKDFFDRHGENLSRWLEILHRGRFAPSHMDVLTPPDKADTHLQFRLAETRLIAFLSKGAPDLVNKPWSEYRAIEFVRDLESILRLPNNYPGTGKQVHERIRTRYYATKQRVGIS